MPRPKIPQQFYGIHLVIISDLVKYIRRKRYDFSVASNPDIPRGDRIPGAEIPSRDDVFALIRLARFPRDILRPVACQHIVKPFSVLFAKWPDEVLDLLRFIRAKLAAVDGTQSGRVKRFLRTRRHIRDEKGNEVAVSELADCDIARYLTRSGFNVPTGSVKKARQTIAREDREIFRLSEHPQYQEFIRTGTVNLGGEKVMPPDPKFLNLFRPVAKGKN